MYEACGEGFAEPTEYVRQMLPVTLATARQRGLDLCLQLAGRPPAADRLGTVCGEVDCRHSGMRLLAQARNRYSAGYDSGPTLRVSRNDDAGPVNSREKADNLRIFGGAPISMVGWQPPPTHRKSPMRFTPQFLDELRARLPVSEVVGRRVKLKKAGREWKGLSPFQQEKTPSFTVNDQKRILPRLLLRQARQHLSTS